MIAQIVALAGGLAKVNLPTLGLGLGVLAIMLIGERLGARFPSALIGLALAAGLTAGLGLEAHGVATLGAVASATPHFVWPAAALDDLPQLDAAGAVDRAGRHGADGGDDAQLRRQFDRWPRCRARFRRLGAPPT